MPRAVAPKLGCCARCCRVVEARYDEGDLLFLCTHALSSDSRTPWRSRQPAPSNIMVACGCGGGGGGDVGGTRPLARLRCHPRRRDIEMGVRLATARAELGKCSPMDAVASPSSKAECGWFEKEATALSPAQGQRSRKHGSVSLFAPTAPAPKKSRWRGEDPPQAKTQRIWLCLQPNYAFEHRNQYALIQARYVPFTDIRPFRGALCNFLS